MDLLSLGTDVLQNVAEHAASYRLGQSLLRHLDRALWVVEKCARWAVPPPLDQDERPQPDLVRPLPWLFFLMMLIALRITRESISLLNLVMGKPPLRSADVVVFFQGKRRYLRTLKYQGNRMMRARTSATIREPWYNSLYKLFELTMCFRRQSDQYGNNNTTRVSNNDEVMVVKRSKRGRQEVSPTTSANETTMERLIEKMMVDLDAESDEESCYTLTNVTSTKSESDFTLESDSETTIRNKSATPTIQNGSASQNGDEELHFLPTEYVNSSTPEKDDKHNNRIDSKTSDETQPDILQNDMASSARHLDDNNISGIPRSGKSQFEKFRDNINYQSPDSNYTSCDDASPQEKRVLTIKQISENLVLTESQGNQRTPKREHKSVNGRTVKSVPNKNKGPRRERQSLNEMSPAKVLSSNNSF